MNRTTGIILTIVTVLCCACPGFGICIWGVMGIAGVPITTTVGDQTSVQPMPTGLGVALLCLSVIMIIIPVVVAFFAFRNKPAAAPQNMDGTLPPAS